MNECSNAPPTDEAADVQLWQRWRDGQQVEVREFLRGFPDLTATEVVAVLLIDQSERWQRGERICVESYLRLFPHLNSDFEAVVELAFGEFILRDKRGEQPSLEEYLWRFPQHAERLRQQVQLYLALRNDESMSLQTGPGAVPAELFTLIDPSDGMSALPSVPGYEILEKLGRGGMGVVYRARQVKANRIVALKMLLAGSHAGAAELERFRTEAEAIARLQHPSIVQIFEVGEHAGLPFFSLEFCPGGGLDRKLGGTPIPSGQAAALVGTLALAMQAAHANGIIHRDLKPGNILLAFGSASDGTHETDGTNSADKSHPSHWPHYSVPKITDFGLAKNLDEAGQTQTGAVMGTPSYMSPEQAQGRRVGPAADVYALGAILYECLTGRPPFKAASAAETIRQVVNDQPVPPSHLQPTTPRDLETICLKCLRKEPEMRYPSAQALADDLRRWQAGEPIMARPVGRWERGVRWCRRNPAVAGASALALLMLVLVTVGSIVFALEQRRAAKREADAAAVTTNALQDARLNQAQLSLEHAMKLCEEGEQGNHRDPYRGLLWLARALELAPDDAGELQRILRLNWAAWRRDVCPLQGVFPGQVTQVAWGRSGKIMLALVGGEPRAWDTASGQLIPLPDLSRLNARFLSSSDDGRTAALVLPNRDRITVWDLKKGNFTRIGTAHSGGISALAVSPDGRLFLTGSADGKARLWERDTGKMRGNPYSIEGPIRVLAFRPDGKAFAAGTRAVGNSPATVRQWEIATEKPLGKRFPIRHKWDCHSLDYSADGKKLLIAFGYFLTFCDIETGALSPHPFVHGEAIEGARFVPGGETLVDSTVTGETLVWDQTTWRPLVAPITSTYGFNAVAVSPDGRSVATGCGRTEFGLRLWQLPPHPVHLRLPQRGEPLSVDDGISPTYHRNGLRAVAVSSDGKLLATGGWNKLADIWDAETGGRVRSLVGHDGVVTSLVFSRDGKQLLTGSTDTTARLWDVRTGKQLVPPLKHGGIVHGVDISPDGACLLTSCSDGTCGMWKMNGEKLSEWNMPQSSPIWSVAFSPDGRSCAAALWRTIAFRDLAGRQAVREFVTGNHHVVAFAFSPDGKRFVSAGLDKTAQVRDTKTGKPVGASITHRERFFPTDEGNLPWMRMEPWNRTRLISVAFHPNGRIVATGDQCRTARLWDADTGTPVGPPLEHPGGVHAMTFTPDGHYLLTVSSDSVVRRWPVPVVVGDDPALLVLRTQVLTGMELVDGAVRLLDAETWQERQRRLAELSPDMGSFFKPVDEQFVRLFKARSYFRDGEWSQAVDWFSKALALKEDASVRQERAKALAVQGKWDQAAADLARAIELRPESHGLWYLAVMVGTQRGNKQEYRRLCKMMIERFANTTDPNAASGTVNACLIMGGEREDLRKLSQLADLAIAEEADRFSRPWIVISKALAEYRSGHHAEAAGWLQKILSKKRGIHLMNSARYLLAMAQQKQGKVKEAKITMTLARQQLQSREQAGANWANWLFSDHLRREAEALLAGAKAEREK